MTVFDPLSDSMLADPHVVYAEFQREEPVAWHEGLNAWLMFRHADCVRVITDVATFSNDLTVLGEDPPIAILGLQNLDPPQHTAVRRPLLRALRQVNTDEWVRACLDYTDVLLEKLDPQSVEFVSEVSEKVSLESMRLLFGVADFGDPDAFHRAQRDLVLSMDAGLDPSRGAPGVSARQYLSDLLEPWLRNPPPTGLLSTVDAAAAGPMGRYLTNSLRSILVAGFLSSSSMLGCTVHTLARAGLLDRDAAWPVDATAYNEMVRHSGAVQVEGRACAEDVRIGGRTVRRGDEVLTVLAAANRDPAVFTEPDRLLLDRAVNPHLGFGRGTHSCLGANLALRLHRPLLERLVERYRITPAGEPRFRRTATLRGLDRLPLTLRPR